MVSTRETVLELLRQVSIELDHDDGSGICSRQFSWRKTWLPHAALLAISLTEWLAPGHFAVVPFAW